MPTALFPLLLPSEFHSFQISKCCAPASDIQTTVKIPISCSAPGTSGHPENRVYRCCLPTLTGFPRFRHPEVRRINAFHRILPLLSCLVRGFNPAIADCRLQGSANPPSSTARINILRPWTEGKPEDSIFHFLSLRFPCTTTMHLCVSFAERTNFRFDIFRKPVGNALLFFPCIPANRAGFAYLRHSSIAICDGIHNCSSFLL